MTANIKSISVMIILVLGYASGLQANVVIETVRVGNAGNAGEWSGESQVGGWGPDRICGKVDYDFNIGIYEVTAGQYTEFLNAVAATDLYGLYNEKMDIDSGLPDSAYGCNIKRIGTQGNYVYSVTDDWASRPVNYVSWGDATRFSNWMHNGQGKGGTETGSYTLNGAITDSDLQTVARNPNSTWAISSEDEWYKAAYHKNDGVTGNYFGYPTSNDSVDYDMANYDMSVGNIVDAGTYSFPSPYGTYDQGGNVWEWNETVVYSSRRGMRGGSFNGYGGTAPYLHGSFRGSYMNPTYEGYTVGFRLTYVPEPASLALLTLGGIGLLGNRKC